MRHDDKKAVANASIFLSNTTVGTETRADGSFSLANVKPGKYDLVITVIGFETYRQKITVINSNIDLHDILLLPKINSLNEVVISSKSKNYLPIYFERFKREFLGTSYLASEVKILNPKVLNMDYDEKTEQLTASSSGFLEIENQGLGYHMKYLLNEFSSDKLQVKYSGPILFTEMAGTERQKRRWQQRRQEIYEGSTMHFLRTSVSDQLNEQGFEVLRLTTYPNPNRPADSLIIAKINRFDVAHYKTAIRDPDSLAYWKKMAKLPKTFRTLIPYPLTKRDMILKTDQPGMYALGCDGDTLLVIHKKNGRFLSVKDLANSYTRNYILAKPDNRDMTQLSIRGTYALFDQNGYFIDPYSVEFKGAWAHDRLADLLPTDFDPVQNKIAYDDSLLKNTTAKLDSFTGKLPVEKVYLHLDKPGGYLPGDTIWYKTYAVTGGHHQLSNLSGILYVELINPKDSIILRQTIHLLSGIAWGDIALTGTLKPGNYRIRAYTNWMRNMPEYFYDHHIAIGGIGPVPSRPVIVKNPDVQFFPEGGQLLNGVQSKVAIKSIGVNGLGENIKGTIEDNEGKVIANFETAHLGMGQFFLTPQNDKNYQAKITAGGGAVFSVDLPKSRDAGYTLSLNNDRADSIFVKIAVNDKTLSEKKENVFYIIAQCGGKVYYTTEGKLEKPAYTVSIDKNRFPSGIAQFTLFSQTGEPLAERIAFIQNNDALKLQLGIVAQSNVTRGNMKIKLTAKNSDDLPSDGSFSVAVINETRAMTDENAESTLINNLLLTSDLKGFIEQPNYYFTEGNRDQKQADLDILMLSQGYRRFDWKQVLHGPIPPATFKPERDLSISGILTTSLHKPIPYGRVSLLSINNPILKDTTADANGRFKFDHLPPTDSMMYVIKPMDKKMAKNSLIKIDTARPAADTMAHGGFINNITSAYAQVINDNTRKTGGTNAIALKGVTIREKTTRKYLEHSSNLRGPGNADQVITADQLPTGCPVFVDCVSKLLHGVNFFSNNVPGKKSPLIVIDGMELNDTHASDSTNLGNYGILDALNMNDIASIEVLSNTSTAAVYGVRADGGVVIITTKMGDDMHYSTISSPGLSIYSAKGYYTARTFYSPRYDTPGINSKFPDLRTTIYWNPNLVTDKEGNVSFEYFNADTKGAYRVVIEGIDDNGNLGRQVYRYKVE
jgi:TonB-dependent SusC/RagA subfamily outer membrane receptor